MLISTDYPDVIFRPSPVSRRIADEFAFRSAAGTTRFYKVSRAESLSGNVTGQRGRRRLWPRKVCATIQTTRVEVINSRNAANRRISFRRSTFRRFYCSNFGRLGIVAQCESGRTNFLDFHSGFPSRAICGARARSACALPRSRPQFNIVFNRVYLTGCNYTTYYFVMIAYGGTDRSFYFFS